MVNTFFLSIANPQIKNYFYNLNLIHSVQQHLESLEELQDYFISYHL